MEREREADNEAPGKHAIPVKTSVGIILCRRNATTERPEALLVQKRYTYAFSEFVHGRYAGGRSGSALRCVAPLLAGMTREELFDIHSLNFEQMWYRVWLTCENRDLYNKKHAKFQSTFLRDDGGEALRREVDRTRPTASLLWEVPKGRRLSAREVDITCATRELHEETGVEKKDYRILPGIKRWVNYVSAGTRYICIYYVAIANPHLSCDRRAGVRNAPPNIRELRHMAEISRVEWHDIEHVRLLNGADSRLEKLISPAFLLMKKYQRGRWDSRPGAATALAPAPAAAPAPPPPPPASEDSGSWRQTARKRARRRRPRSPAKK